MQAQACLNDLQLPLLNPSIRRQSLHLFFKWGAAQLKNVTEGASSPKKERTTHLINGSSRGVKIESYELYSWLCSLVRSASGFLGTQSETSN